MATEVTVEGRCVVTANGVFKIVRKESGQAASAG
jgi:hypothetical protein